MLFYDHARNTHHACANIRYYRYSNNCDFRKKGQLAPIKSNYGRIFYEYIKDPGSATSMVRGLVRWCQNGETVELP